MPKINQLEQQHQIAFFEWRNAQIGRIPHIERMFSYPAGGARNITVAKKVKAEGQAKGMLDVQWPYPRGEYHGFYFELKVIHPSGHKGSLSESQKSWLEYLKSQNYYASWGFGWDSLRQAVEQYSKLGPYQKSETKEAPAASPRKKPKAAKHQQRYIEILSLLITRSTGFLTGDICSETGIPIQTINQKLLRMQGLGLIRKAGKQGKRNIWKNTTEGAVFLTTKLSSQEIDQLKTTSANAMRELPLKENL